MGNPLIPDVTKRNLMDQSGIGRVDLLSTLVITT